MKNLFLSVLSGLLFVTGINAQTILLGPQPFNTDVLTHGGTAPVTAWFAPSSNTPLSYVSTGGNPGGYAGYSGSWNNYWGNFLRLPQVNCTGNDTVVVSFDFCNSYFAAQPNDRIRFYLWDQGGSAYHNDVSSIKINGVESMVNFGANGYGFRFDVARTWVRVDVRFFLSNVTNKSNVLFYMEPSCGYNNSNVYFVKFDNIQVATTAILTAPDVTAHTGDTMVCAGSIVKLKVHATGTAPLSFTWKRNGNLIGTYSDSTLTLSPVSVPDAGAYRCIVSNLQGSDSTALINLTVNNPPAATMITPDTAICEGSSVTLKAHVSSFMVAGMTWYFNNVLQNTATDSIYTIAGAASADDGTYFLRVNNTCGTANSDTIRLRVHQRPVPFIGNDTTVCSGVTLTLDAGPDYDTYNWSTGSQQQTALADTFGLGAGIHTFFVFVTDTNQCSGSDTIQIDFDICSGISLPATENSFDTYPNPVKDKITIHADEGVFTASIFDATGRLLITERFNNQREAVMDVSELTTGIYLIRVNDTIVRKLIK